LKPVVGDCLEYRFQVNGVWQWFGGRVQRLAGPRWPNWYEVRFEDGPCEVLITNENEGDAWCWAGGQELSRRSDNVESEDELPEDLPLSDDDDDSSGSSSDSSSSSSEEEEDVEVVVVRSSQKRRRLSRQ